MVLWVAIGIAGVAVDSSALHGSGKGVNPVEHIRDYLIVLIIHLALAERRGPRPARGSVATHNPNAWQPR